MKPIVRFCEVAVVRSGINSEGAKLHSFVVDDIFLQKHWNWSTVFVRHPSECIDKMSRNETDIVPTLEFYPMYSDVVKYCAIIRDSENFIISSTVPVNHTAIRMESTQSLAAFSSFSNPVLVLTLLFMLLFYLLFMSYCKAVRGFKIKRLAIRVGRLGGVLHTRIKKSAGSTTPGKIVIGVMLKQTSSCTLFLKKRSSFKLLFILYVYLMSCMHFLFIAFTRTELVIVDRPLVFDSYQKILQDPKIMPTWLGYLQTYVQFRKANVESVERQLWNKARRNVCPENRKQCLEWLNTKNMNTFLERMSRQEIALIATDYVARIVHAGLCPLASLMSLNPVVMKVDKNVIPVPLAVGHSRLMEQSLADVAAAVTRRGRQAAASGIASKLTILTKSPMSMVSDAATVRKCLHPEQDEDDNEPKPIVSKPWSDFQLLCSVCLAAIVLALVLLLISKLIDLWLVKKGDE